MKHAFSKLDEHSTGTLNPQQFYRLVQALTKDNPTTKKVMEGAWSAIVQTTDDHNTNASTFTDFQTWCFRSLDKKEKKETTTTTTSKTNNDESGAFAKEDAPIDTKRAARLSAMMSDANLQTGSGNRSSNTDVVPIRKTTVTPLPPRIPPAIATEPATSDIIQLQVKNVVSIFDVNFPYTTERKSIELPEVKKDILKQMFDSHDLEKNGTLSVDELMLWFVQSLSIPKNEYSNPKNKKIIKLAVLKVFKAYDKNNEQGIQFEELYAWMLKMQKLPIAKREQLKDVSGAKDDVKKLKKKMIQRLVVLFSEQVILDETQVSRRFML